MHSYPLCLDLGRFTKSPVVQSRLVYIQSLLNNHIARSLKQDPTAIRIFLPWNVISSAVKVDEAELKQLLGPYSSSIAGMEVLIGPERN